MKKKSLFICSLALLLSVSLAACSFLPDTIEPSDGGGGNGNTDGGKSGIYNPDKLDVWDFDTKGIVLENRVTNFQLNDRFVVPDVYLKDANDELRMVTNAVVVSEIDKDYSKPVNVDMSTLTGEEGKTIYVSYRCLCPNKKNRNEYGQYSFTSYYKIRINERRDSHYDPEGDDSIKTLELTDVVTSFNENDTFEKPKVWAVKKDNSKSEITNSCVFDGYDMATYGYQTVTATYNDHTISYEIVVHNREEEQQYPFFLNILNMRMNIQKGLFVTSQNGRLYFLMYEKDGSITNYGAGFGHFIDNVDYTSDNEKVVTIDDEGFFRTHNAGSAFLYATVNDLNGTEKYVYRAKIIVEDRKLVELKVNNYKYNYYSGHDIHFAGDVVAVYQNGYEEPVTPDIDLTKVDINVPGEYDVVLSYSVNGETLSLTKKINIVDSSLYTLEKVDLGSSIYDYNHTLRMPSILSIGTVKSLVVPVKFSDSGSYITNYDNVREDIEKCFFGTNEEVGWRSVKSYYEEESKGLLTYEGKVSEVYNDSHPTTDYYTDDLTDQLKENVLEWYFNEHPEEDIKDYDANNDGYFDSLNLIYLAPDANTSGVTRKVADNLWARVKANNLKLPDVDNPACNRYLWASYDFIYPTNEIALERTGKSNYSAPAFSSGNYNRGNEKLIARTFIHEAAHMLGIDDYYSYTEDVYFAGDLNMQTLNYMGHDPYSLMLYNWAKPYIPEISTTITIGDFQKTHDVILLTPSWNSLNSPFDEYFLLDLYVPSSGLNEFDATVKYPNIEAFNTIGVRLWHVDARLATIDSSYDEFTFDPTEAGVHLITDNSYGQFDSDNLQKYDRFMQLQLVRNDQEYDYATSGPVNSSHYFKAGDTFSMDDFSSQFVNGNKMDNGKELGWTIQIDGIYLSDDGYIADITVTRL